MPEFVVWTRKVPKGIDIIEACGGEGRFSQVCLRRQFKAGFNFDLRCGINLRRPADVQFLWQYIKEDKPFTILMGPPCAFLGQLRHEPSGVAGVLPPMQARRRVVRAVGFAPTHTPKYLFGGTTRPKWSVHGTTVAKGA
eukprot:7650489-Lingulodinium_polyedra.AAC.1